jgi:uncharacterized protein YndB with AHSA1/START domain
MIMDRTPDRIFLTFIAAPPEKVWALLTDATQSPDWFFGQRMDVGTAKGDAFLITTPDGNHPVKGEVLVIDPPQRLLVSWNVQMPGVPKNEIEFLIEDMGTASKLTIHEYHLGEVPEKFLKSGREGWSLTLASIKTLLETGKKMPTIKLESPQ